MNYHIRRLVLSSLCVGAFDAAGFRWCSFCRLKHQSTQRIQNKTTDVVIQQHSRKLLKMDILMSETCWAHKKWNKIASDIKLVFHSSTITMMHGPINIRLNFCLIQVSDGEMKGTEIEGIAKLWVLFCWLVIKFSNLQVTLRLPLFQWSVGSRKAS